MKTKADNKYEAVSLEMTKAYSTLYLLLIRHN